MREEYEFRLKVKRDARARDSYVRKEGIAIGRTEAIVELLQLKWGPVPEEIVQHVSTQRDLAVLSEWHKLAVQAGSLEEFRKNIG